MAKNHYLIGLTGNIACGKSVVAAMLRELGAEVVDADRVVHEVMRPGTEVLRAIARRFGPEVVGPGGSIDRAKLGQIVFNDPAALEDLEAILHPAARRVAEERIAASRKRVVVLEAIKLIEAGWKELVDSLWVVTCPRDQRIERLMRTRGMGQAEAALRVDVQNPESEKVKLADVVIDNSGTLEETRRQVEEAFGRVTGS